MFILTEENISPDKINKWGQEYSNPSVGAVVHFSGLVRNHNEGKQVLSLEYLSYSQMALKVGNQIVTKAKLLFPVTDLFCVHRTGHLAIGDTAIWVMASGAHRKEAFNACEFIVNEIKSLVPIWKQEHYLNEAPEWVACHHCQQHHE